MADKYNSWSTVLPQGVAMEAIFTYAAGMLVVGAAIYISKGLMEKQAITSRIRDLKQKRDELKGAYINPKRKEFHRGKKENIAFMQLVVKKFNLLHENKIRDHSKLLVQAGIRSKDAVIKYAFAQGVTAIGFLLLSLFSIKFDMSNIPKTALHLAIPIAATYFGAMLPRILVINKRTKRWNEIRKGLPDALDLMMICTEAGLTLSAALDRVCKEMGMAYPALTEELGFTSVEIGFLPERRKALENLAERVALPEIRALTGVLIQTEKYGTPISQALRVLSKEFRTQRMLAAETKAARLPALMTVPMIVFILPTLFIVVISPAIINVMKN